MLPLASSNMVTSAGNLTSGPMRMVMVSSANTTTAIGKPITITMPGSGQGGLPKTVTIAGKTAAITAGSQIITQTAGGQASFKTFAKFYNASLLLIRSTTQIILLKLMM